MPLRIRQNSSVFSCRIFDMVRFFVTALAALTLNGCGIPAGMHMWLQTKWYSGDGIIYACSNLLAAGYGIDFPKFDSSRYYSASYSLSRVPQVYRIDGRSDPLILLRFYQRDFVAVRERKNSVTATFHVTLSDMKGHIQHSADIPLSTSRWEESQALFGIYDLERSRLHFDKNIGYVLHVEYVPGDTPPLAKELYFTIDNCASY
jgi:hypothetical protein